jgi:hypothetical protein
MKYWELIADKPSANGLVVGLSQRGYAAWPALEADPHKTDGHRYVGEFDELLSAFLELEATLPVILRVVIERFFLRSICNLPRQMTTNLSKADAVEQKSGLGVGCLSPVASSPL